MTFGHNVFGINGYGIGNHIFRAAGTLDDFTGDKVKVFQHCMGDENFSEGWVREFGEGDYEIDDFPNDEASALWIPEGYTVVAHRHDKEGTGRLDENFVGPQPAGSPMGQPDKEETWVGPLAIPCLADSPYDFNDDITRLVISYTAPNDEDIPEEDTNWKGIGLMAGIAAVVVFGLMG